MVRATQWVLSTGRIGGDEFGQESRALARRGVVVPQLRGR